MTGSLQFAAPSALEYFAALVADDDHFSMFEAAVSVGHDDTPLLDVQGVLAEVDELAARLKKRLPADAAPMQRLRALNVYFFHELGFAGNVNDYYDPRNSSVAAVLQTRRGIPITLALVYIEIAGQLGLQAHGVSFPGHFLVKLRMPRGEVVIDPFSGRSLGREEIDERLQPFRREPVPAADDEPPLGLFLQAAPPRDVIARLLRNLKEIHRSAGDGTRLAAVLARLVVLLPWDWDERRELAFALAQIGRFDEALLTLDQFLLQQSDAVAAAEAARLRQQLALRRRAS